MIILFSSSMFNLEVHIHLKKAKSIDKSQDLSVTMINIFSLKIAIITTKAFCYLRGNRRHTQEIEHK